jgi:hypothetical protein
MGPESEALTAETPDIPMLNQAGLYATMATDIVK